MEAGTEDEVADERYDVVVLGVGGMGSATLRALADRGVEACGIEQFDIGHDRGSSHGRTRIIRKAYMEHPEYVPLLHRSYQGWEELEAESERELFVRCGFLTVGRPDSESIAGLEACYAQHQLPHERLDADTLRRRFPQYGVADDMVAVLDPLGGYLRVEDCVAAHVEVARRRGAVVHVGERVLEWSWEGVVSVRTDRRRIEADRLVLTAGAWAAPELRRLGVEVEVWRKVQLWYAAPDEPSFLPQAFPTFYVETGYGHFYGFPVQPEASDRGFKTAEHFVPDVVADPDGLERELRSDDTDLVDRFVEDVFPDAAPARSQAHAVCMYTMTPDEHFVLDVHPRHAGAVVLGGGFSGHGFKFAPVVGEVLADLAVDGDTRQPIDFLRLSRFTNS